MMSSSFVWSQQQLLSLSLPLSMPTRRGANRVSAAFNLTGLTSSTEEDDDDDDDDDDDGVFDAIVTLFATSKCRYTTKAYTRTKINCVRVLYLKVVVVVGWYGSLSQLVLGAVRILSRHFFDWI
jgi:hypothetical protein